MTVDELKRMIDTGEKIDVEFKKCENDLTRDVYKSVCSFNNRNGGHIILGVTDVTKEIRGVHADRVDKILKDFTTSINNANKINPPMYLTPEVFDNVDGKTLIYIRVPEGTQLRRLNGRIWDRTHEGDIDVTDNAELVYKMYARKQSTYFVNRVYPRLGLDFLDFEVIGRVKKMAVSRVDDHPWTNMSEEEILRSTGLIQTDPDKGEEGITLAAILLFGKDSTIMSVLPQYKTDAIYRVKNVDRYDDREVIITNLIDSYRRLMDFGKKHLNDTFVLDGDQSVSARDKILREIISNILAHRDYSDAYTAQFVIENNRIYTKNSNLPHGHGELKLNQFEPFPKNPPISKVFREIGYADELGSGMRNTNKYTKLYSGGTPLFLEDNIFEIVIPMDSVANLQVGPEETDGVNETDRVNDRVNEKVNDRVNENDRVNDGVNEMEKNLLALLIENPKYTVTQLADKLKVSRKTIAGKLQILKEKDLIERIGSSRKGYWKVKQGGCYTDRNVL